MQNSAYTQVGIRRIRIKYQEESTKIRSNPLAQANRYSRIATKEALPLIFPCLLRFLPAYIEFCNTLKLGEEGVRHGTNESFIVPVNPYRSGG